MRTDCLMRFDSSSLVGKLHKMLRCPVLIPVPYRPCWPPTPTLVDLLKKCIVSRPQSTLEPPQLLSLCIQVGKVHRTQRSVVPSKPQHSEECTTETRGFRSQSHLVRLRRNENTGSEPSACHGKDGERQLPHNQWFERGLLSLLVYLEKELSFS